MSKENVENKDSKKKNTTNKKSSTARKSTAKKTVREKNTETKANNKKRSYSDEKMKKEVKEIVSEAEEKDEDIYFDEDLDDFFNEDEEEVEVKEVRKDDKKDKKKDEKKEKKDEKKHEKVEMAKIKKIEKMAKKNNKVKKSNTTDIISKIGYFLDNNRNVILAFIIGVIVTIIGAFIIWPERIATLKNGEQPVVKVAGKTYTANNLYKRMKDFYSVSQLLDEIDSDILTKKYPETEEMKKEVESTAENYINMYKQYYNYTEEQFLSANGFSSHDAYLEYLMLDNRRKKYEEEYVEKNLTDKEIQKYYDDNVYGAIKCEHILVEVSSEDTSSTESSKSSKKLSDDEAKKLAQEIIDKINDGTSWKDIQKEYKDKVTYENLGYQAWDSDLETSFKDALRKMDDKSYSSEPVKTSYGYHVIYRESQKATPSLKKTKTKIIDKLVDSKIQEDNNLLYKALISLRNDKKIKFSDTDMKAKYEAYKKQYNK